MSTTEQLRGAEAFLEFETAKDERLPITSVEPGTVLSLRALDMYHSDNGCYSDYTVKVHERRPFEAAPRGEHGQYWAVIGSTIDDGGIESAPLVLVFNDDGEMMRDGPSGKITETTPVDQWQVAGYFMPEEQSIVTA